MMGDVAPAPDLRGPLVGRAFELDRLVKQAGQGDVQPALERLREDPALALGANVINGHVTYNGRARVPLQQCQAST